MNHSTRRLYTLIAAAPAVAWRPTALLLATAMLLAACQPKQEATVAPPTPVRVALVTEGPSRPPIETTGVVAARDEQRLSFKVGGLVQQIAVREGDRVRAGQLLARLDPTEIGAQVDQARQLAEKAERDLARGQALQADQVIPLEQLQNLATQAEVARAQLAAARFNQQSAVITATGDGVVLRRLVEEREFAAPGQVVLVLGRQDSGFVVRFAVSDRNVVQLRRGDVVTLRLDAWPDERFEARVSQIASAADPASGLFQLEARLADTPRALVTGLVGRVQLAPAADAQRLAYVPIGAVLEGDGENAAVFVAEGEVARRRAVKVAFITADRVAIREGVAIGEPVIATGAPYLDDGDPIAIAQPE